MTKNFSFLVRKDNSGIYIWQLVPLLYEFSKLYIELQKNGNCLIICILAFDQLFYTYIINVKTKT